MRSPQSFIQRLPSGSPDGLDSIITTGFTLAASFEDKVKSIRSDRSLSEEGKRQAFAFLRNGSGYTQHLAQLKKEVADGLTGFRADRAKLRPAALDKSDLAGELRHGEIRSYLRGLPMHERMSLAQNDPEIRAAILHAPAILSGLPTDVHASLID